MAKLRVVSHRNGKRIVYYTPDKGAPGRTPESRQWYDPKTESGWGKGMPQRKRRSLVLKAQKGDELAAAQALQALANVTTDRDTRIKARSDAEHFYRLHARKVKQMRVSSKFPRITPSVGRLR